MNKYNFRKILKKISYYKLMNGHGFFLKLNFNHFHRYTNHKLNLPEC